MHSGRDVSADMILLPSGLHFVSFFSILVRARRISQQLQHLSKLTLKDLEKGEGISERGASPVPIVNNRPRNQTRYNDSEHEQTKTIAATITAIRSPCAELEGSNRWTIVSEKPLEHR